MTVADRPLHVVQGASAGGCLRAALPEGSVIAVVDDDLSTGPVTDRSEFLRSGYRGYLPVDQIPDDRPDPWSAVSDALRRDPGAIVVWVGTNPADAVLTAALCEALADSGVTLWRVDLTRWSGGDGPHYVAEYEPSALSHAWPAAAELVSADERESWRATYREIVASGDSIRRVVADGSLRFLPVDAYDELLLAACPAEWTSAARVVGTAMGACDDDNLMSDVFFTRRLQHLIASGAIDVAGPRDSLRTYRVRRPG